MKLKVKLTGKSFIEKIAVVTDEDTEASEVIKVDEVRVTAFMISLQDGIAHVNFVIGGRDSLGNFHPDLKYQHALWSLHKTQNPGVWEQFIGSKASWSFLDLLSWIHKTDGVQAAGKNIWNLPDIVSEEVP